MSDINDKKDHAAVRFPPPFVGILAIIIGYVLGRFVPIMDDFLVPAPARYWVGGAVVIIAGVVLGWWPIKLFQETEQDVKPWTSTPEIVVKGPYKFTRNPMYLMMVVVCIGFSIILDEAWVFVMAPVCGYVNYLVAIRHEEAYLEGKFGAAYAEYRSSVRRWL